jgi:hypothetical protein
LLSGRRADRKRADERQRRDRGEECASFHGEFSF